MTDIQDSFCKVEVRQKAVDLYLHKLRAEEEIHLSKEEMQHCLQWYASQSSVLQEAMKSATTRGEVDAICQKHNAMMKAFKMARLLFSDYLPESELPRQELFSDDYLVSRIVVMEEDLVQEDLDPDDLTSDELDSLDDMSLDNLMERYGTELGCHVLGTPCTIVYILSRSY